MKFFKQLTKADYLVALSIGIFLIYKLATLTFRFGDGNAYLYMANSIWHGIWPYRDFFVADPPVLIMFLSFLKPIFGQQWLWLHSMPYLWEAGNALLIYLLLHGRPQAYFASILYLFSFTILATSEFLTGVQLTVLFSLLGFYCQKKDYPLASGIFWGLAVTTKFYALPAWIGFWLYTLWTKQPWGRLTFGFFASVIAVFLPFLILSPQGLVDSIILHQFNRTAGNNIWSVWRYFIQQEWPLLILAIAGSFLSSARKYLLPFWLSVIFFLVFQDLYYTYLGFLFFFLAIFAGLWIEYLIEQKDLVVILFLASCLGAWTIFGGIYHYENSSATHGRFSNAPEIAEYLKTQTDHEFIYGSHEVAPLLALMSGKQLFGNYIDTNTQVFAAGTLDKNQISERAAEAGVYLVARITDLPEQGIKDMGYDGFFSPEVFAASCRRLQFFPSTSREIDTHIGIYDCSRN